MAETHHDKVVKYFKEKVKEGAVQRPIDMAIILKKHMNDSGGPLEGQREYVEKVLAAGYKSATAKKLHADIVESFKPNKSK